MAEAATPASAPPTSTSAWGHWEKAKQSRSNSRGVRAKAKSGGAPSKFSRMPGTPCSWILRAKFEERERHVRDVEFLSESKSEAPPVGPLVLLFAAHHLEHPGADRARLRTIEPA